MTGEGPIVGLDIGDVRIGVAVSDPLCILAEPREVIVRSTPEADVGAIQALLEKTGAVQIVAGLPLTMAGEKGHQAEKVLAFVDLLRGAVEVEVDLQDERLSTAAARRDLAEGHVRRKRHKQMIDGLAAQHILQTYLDRKAWQRREEQS